MSGDAATELRGALIHEVSLRTGVRRDTAAELVGWLMLPISEHMEAECRRRAAEELRAAATEFRGDRDDATNGVDPGDPWTYNEAALTCTQRADAIEGQA